MSLEDAIRDNVDPLLTPRAAAKRLGVTTETLRRWIRNGVLVYAEVGPKRSKRFRQSQIDRHRVEPPSCST